METGKSSYVPLLFLVYYLVLFLNTFTFLFICPSDLPHNVSQVEALKHEEVRRRLHSGLQMLQAATLVFLHRICDSKTLIPYGLLYIARTLKQALLEKFPDTPEKDILKVKAPLNVTIYFLGSIELSFELNLIVI